MGNGIEVLTHIIQESSSTASMEYHEFKFLIQVMGTLIAFRNYRKKLQNFVVTVGPAERRVKTE